MKKLLLQMLSIILVTFGNVFSETILLDIPLPIVDTSFEWQPLRDKVSPQLNKKLMSTLSANSEWNKLIKKKKFAVGIVDLSDIYNPEAAWVNGNVMMYAASLPKIVVLLAAMQALEEGTLEESNDLIDTLKLMMRKSDNGATTAIIDKVGLKKIEAVVTSPEYHLFNPEKGGGLWVGKRYAKKGPRNPDPLKGLSHAATVSQVCRFYYLLATGRLVSPHRSKQMLDIMASPQIYHKFVNPLKKKYSLNRIFRKSGSWQIWHSDSVLLWSKDGKARYILVGLVESPKGEQILRDLVPVIDRLLVE